MPFDGWMDGWGEMAANARQPPPLFFFIYLNGCWMGWLPPATSLLPWLLCQHQVPRLKGLKVHQCVGRVVRSCAFGQCRDQSSYLALGSAPPKHFTGRICSGRSPCPGHRFMGQAVLAARLTPLS